MTPELTKERLARRFWTNHEDQTVRELYGKLHPREIAARLDRSLHAVYIRAAKLGLTFDRRAELGPEFEQFLRDKKAEDWTDEEVAGEWGCNVETVGIWRRKLNIPSIRFGKRHLENMRKRTRLQCRDAGVRNLGELRGLVWGLRAVKNGWPAGITKGEEELLEALEAGPATRRILCERMGKPWKGCKSLTNHEGRSRLEGLRQRGIVRRGKRLSTGEYPYELAIQRTRHVA